MSPWLRYLIAFVVACHGFTYIPFGILIPDKLKEWRGTSLLFGDTFTRPKLKVIVMIVHIITGIAILACAIAIGVAPSAPGLWRLFAIIGAAFGIEAFVVFWDGQTKLFVQEGGIGLIISLILLVFTIVYGGGFS